MSENGHNDGESTRSVVYPEPPPLPGLIPGTDQYEEMRVPTAADEATTWAVHLADGGTEVVPGSFTFRVSSGLIIFHEWGEQVDLEGRRERKARFIFPMVRVKFIAKLHT